MRELLLGVTLGLGAGVAPGPLLPVRRAVTINVLNPAPWVFWIGVGAPILTDAGSLRAASAFVIAFYATLVGVKATVATLVGAGRRRLLAGRGYAIALRGAALLMVATGVVLVVHGVRSLP